MRVIIEFNEAEKQELFTEANRMDDHHRSEEVYSNKVAHALMLKTKHLYHDSVYEKAREIVHERV